MHRLWYIKKQIFEYLHSKLRWWHLFIISGFIINSTKAKLIIFEVVSCPVIKTIMQYEENVLIILV